MQEVVACGGCSTARQVDASARHVEPHVEQPHLTLTQLRLGLAQQFLCGVEVTTVNVAVREHALGGRHRGTPAALHALDGGLCVGHCFNGAAERVHGQTTAQPHLGEDERVAAL